MSSATSPGSSGSGTAGGSGKSNANSVPPSSSHANPSANNTDMRQQILTRKQLQELVKQVDPNEQLDEDVEDLLLSYADDFMQDLIEGACTLAAHRKSNAVECRDVQTHLERSSNTWLPGFGTDELRPYKRAPVTEAHKQRMALIKKTLKKY